MAATLVVKAGLTDKKEYTLQPGKPYSMGRSREADVVVKDQQASRHHCTIETGPDGHWKLTDHDSSNGTYVNRQRVASRPLTDGDVVQVGKATFEFHVEGAARPAARPSVADDVTAIVGPAQVSPPASPKPAEAPAPARQAETAQPAAAKPVVEAPPKPAPAAAPSAPSPAAAPPKPTPAAAPSLPSPPPSAPSPAAAAPRPAPAQPAPKTKEATDDDISDLLAFLDKIEAEDPKGAKKPKPQPQGRSVPHEAPPLTQRPPEPAKKPTDEGPLFQLVDEAPPAPPEPKKPERKPEGKEEKKEGGGLLGFLRKKKK